MLPPLLFPLLIVEETEDLVALPILNSVSEIIFFISADIHFDNIYSLALTLRERGKENDSPSLDLELRVGNGIIRSYLVSAS